MENQMPKPDYQSSDDRDVRGDGDGGAHDDHLDLDKVDEATRIRVAAIVEKAIRDIDSLADSATVVVLVTYRTIKDQSTSGFCRISGDWFAAQGMLTYYRDLRYRQEMMSQLNPDSGDNFFKDNSGGIS
jgi:hypothetical protein